MPLEPDTAPLRVAVIVASLTVSEWVASTVERIDSEDAYELVAVELAPASEKVARPAAYRAYEWLDRRAFGAADGLGDADLAPLAAGRTVAAGDGLLDVVLSFLPAARSAAWSGPPPRYGVWAIVPMDDGEPGAAPDRFWDVRGRRAQSATALVIVQPGRARVLARCAAPVDRLSVTRSRNAAAWAAAHLVLRSLRSLARDHGSLPPGDDAVGEQRPPPTAVIVTHAARTAVRGLAARSRTAWRRGEWFVAVRERSADGRVRGPLTALPNPPGRYLADPFPIAVGGRHHLFVEDYSQAAGRAVISVCEPEPDGTWSEPRTVLERDHHLSYPFVFEHEGVVYMLPETGEAGRVELHRAVAFPDEWRLDRVLLDGLTAVDATLHVEEGRLWLFAHVVEGHGDPGELRLHWADSLDGDFSPHPRNPIVTDPATARPAGRLFRRDGVLYRPGQDCSRRYGEAVVLNRVDALSPEDYRETPVARIEPDWMPGIDATHTYTFDSRYECCDGYRHASRLHAGRRG